MYHFIFYLLVYGRNVPIMIPSPRRRNLSFIVLKKLIATGCIPIAVTFLSCLRMFHIPD